ncbi:cysteine hydrolase family protein [Rhizobium sp. G21]|uniref:cysteine hydrolase family protein n=1 Tax=Rhizobium sp. G21 TaxID=2758439 RepID=UPI001603F66E|nr:isochorismatase family cysteine hydrolase [Rhizobium sp. G21]MBB1249261.1 cysteine hydrolase [Rhizobium sp. G21]
MTVALMIIDMQIDALAALPPECVEPLIDRQNRLARAFRARSLPVIMVCGEFKADLSDAFLEMRRKQVAVSIEGTPGAALHPGLERDADDIEIVKKRYSTFFRTNLDEILANRGVTRLVLTGVNTHACIRMAAVDAYQRDLDVVIAEDAVASYDDQHASVSLRYMTDKIAAVMSADSAIAALPAWMTTQNSEIRQAM